MTSSAFPLTYSISVYLNLCEARTYECGLDYHLNHPHLLPFFIDAPSKDTKASSKLRVKSILKVLHVRPHHRIPRREELRRKDAADARLAVDELPSR